MAFYIISYIGWLQDDYVFEKRNGRLRLKACDNKGIVMAALLIVAIGTGTLLYPRVGLTAEMVKGVAWGITAFAGVLSGPLVYVYLLIKSRRLDKQDPDTK